MLNVNKNLSFLIEKCCIELIELTRIKYTFIGIIQSRENTEKQYLMNIELFRCVTASHPFSLITKS